MKSANLSKFEKLISQMTAQELNKAVSIFNVVQAATKKEAIRSAKNQFTTGSKVYLSGHEDEGVYTVIEMRRTKCSVKNDLNGIQYSCPINMLIAA